MPSFTYHACRAVLNQYLESDDQSALLANLDLELQTHFPDFEQASFRDHFSKQERDNAIQRSMSHFTPLQQLAQEDASSVQQQLVLYATHWLSEGKKTIRQLSQDSSSIMSQGTSLTLCSLLLLCQTMLINHPVVQIHTHHHRSPRLLPYHAPQSANIPHRILREVFAARLSTGRNIRHKVGGEKTMRYNNRIPTYDYNVLSRRDKDFGDRICNWKARHMEEQCRRRDPLH